jgi:2-C-methyl-D-erythritol 4-phosphate cytidylyltransferase
MTMKKTAVIVAGGSGVRMGTDVPKQFLHLKGKPIIWHTVQQFFYAYYDIQIVLVLPASYVAEAATYFEPAQLAHIQFVDGGASRIESV